MKFWDLTLGNATQYKLNYFTRLGGDRPSTTLCISPIPTKYRL